MTMVMRSTRSLQQAPSMDMTRLRRGGQAHQVVAALMLVGVAACDSAQASRSEPSTIREGVLGTAQTFAVLGGVTVTSIGATTVHGDLGVAPGLAITGFPPGNVLDGTTNAGDAVALQAQTDTTTAYNALAGQASTADLTGKDLGGMTLTSGVYAFSSSAQLTGTVTLDGKGDPGAVFVFQIGSTLTTASASSVVVVNGAQDCNVFWQVGSSATLGTTTTFKGSLLALTSITLDTGATVSGRVLARNAAVTMDANDVSVATCAASADAGVDAGSRADSASTTASSTASSATHASSSTGASSTSATASTSSTIVASSSATSGTTSATESSTASTTTSSTGVDSGVVDSGSTFDSSFDAGRATGSPP